MIVMIDVVPLIRSVMSNVFYPVGRTRAYYEAAGRNSKLRMLR